MGDYYGNALRRELREEVDGVEPRYVLPQILSATRSHRPEAWLLALMGTVGALLILIGLLLTWGQEQPAPSPSPTSTSLLEA